jgi:transcriptional regulator with XRE-family HTH domain
MDSPLTDFNVKLLRLRNHCGYVQNDLAHFLNMTQPAYQKMEHRSEPPRAKRLQQIAEFYDVPMTDLLLKSVEELALKINRREIPPPRK